MLTHREWTFQVKLPRKIFWRETDVARARARVTQPQLSLAASQRRPWLAYTAAAPPPPNLSTPAPTMRARTASTTKRGTCVPPAFSKKAYPSE